MKSFLLKILPFHSSTVSKRNTDQSTEMQHRLPSSSTPLTDSAVRQVLQTGGMEKVSADFARQLERQLNEYQRNNGQHTLADGKASR